MQKYDLTINLDRASTSKAIEIVLGVLGGQDRRRQAGRQGPPSNPGDDLRIARSTRLPIVLRIWGPGK